MSQGSDVDVRVWFVSFSIFAFTVSCSLVIILAMETTSSDLLFTAGSDIYAYAIASAVLASTVLVGTFLSVISVWFHLRRIQMPAIVGTTCFALPIAFTIFWAASLASGAWDEHMEKNYLEQYWTPFINATVLDADLAAGRSPYAFSLEGRKASEEAAPKREGVEEEGERSLSRFVDASYLSLPATVADTKDIMIAVGRGRQASSRSRLSRLLTESCPEAVPSLHCCGWDQQCPARCNITTSCKKAATSEAIDFSIKLMVICSFILVLVAACAAITMWRNCGRLKDALGDE